MLTLQSQKNVRHQETGCHLCDQPLQQHESFCCKPCTSHITGSEHCQRCGLPATGNPLQCGECISLPPTWQTLTALGHYQFPLDQLIKRYKYQHQPWLAKPLARMLADKITAPAEMLIPVPMHWRRRLQRGYNQSTLLAQALGQVLQIPVNANVLKRQRHTAPQQSLDKKARLTNLKRAFRLHCSTGIAKHVAIVDDVVTTGTTANQLAGLLHEAGAQRVDVYCLSRTPAQ
ncbi:ComF family protein [Thaumasiovibrio subtropicus]|uniref:ComF family protein n=1 Tax=Thaumasiovibrio subtropicus TaxID=1891207 RepID=UPI000B360425|nr:phosphoribosyltransferase family protein [Thaumasiovibrio subtropicus]